MLAEAEQNRIDRREAETYWQKRAEPSWKVRIRIILYWQKRIKTIFKVEKQGRTDTKETEQACQGRCRIVTTEEKQPSLWGENRNILSEGKQNHFNRGDAADLVYQEGRRIFLPGGEKQWFVRRDEKPVVRREVELVFLTKDRKKIHFYLSFC